MPVLDKCPLITQLYCNLVDKLTLAKWYMLLGNSGEHCMSSRTLYVIVQDCLNFSKTLQAGKRYEYVIGNTGHATSEMVI